MEAPISFHGSCHQRSEELPSEIRGGARRSCAQSSAADPIRSDPEVFAAGAHS